MFLLHLYGFILFLYVTGRLIVPSSLPLWAKISLIALALGASQYHLLARYFFGSLSSPEMPYPLLVAASWSFIVMTLLFVFLVLRDAGLLVLWLVRLAGLPARAPFSPGRRAVAVAGLGLAVGTAGYHAAVRVPAVRTTEIALARLPAALDGFSIAHVTDLHASALLSGRRVAAIVDAVNAMEPDLIVCTGDMVDGATSRREADVAPLRDLRARFGVYGCEGNHEYYSGHAAWMDALGELGVTLLRNAHAVLPVKGHSLVLAGLNDPAAARFGMEGPDIGKALRGAPADAPVIALAHQPRHARENADMGVDVQLSGHTHGGQMLGLDRIVAAKNEGFLRGLYAVGDMRLYVSPGVGLWTGFPVRLGVPAEIARIVLRVQTA